MFGKKEPVKNVCPLFCLLNTTIYPQAGLELLKAMQKISGEKNFSSISSQIGMWFNQTDNCTVGSLKHSVLLDPI